jgi:hypothetical protein
MKTKIVQEVDTESDSETDYRPEGGGMMHFRKLAHPLNGGSED